MGGTDWLKRELLLYDKIGMTHLEYSVLGLREYGKSLRAGTYEHLQDVGVIYEMDVPERNEDPDVVQCLKYASEAQERFEYEIPRIQ